MQQLLELHKILHESSDDPLSAVAQRLTEHTADWCLICQMRGSMLSFEAIGHTDPKRREQVRGYISNRNPKPDLAWLQNWNDPQITDLMGVDKITTLPIVGQNGVLGYLAVGLKDATAKLDPGAMLLLQTTASALAGTIERNSLSSRIYSLDSTVHAERGRLYAILQLVPVGIAIVDAQTQGLILSNREMDRLRSDSSEVQHPDGTPLLTLEDPVRRALAGESVRDMELLVVRPNRSQTAIVTGAMPLLDTAGQIEGAVLIWQDVTTLKDAQHTRELLLSAASHELRTPLTSLLGFIQLLETRPDALPERREKWLSYVSEKAHFLARLVEELINLSRAQSGWLRLNLEPTDLRDLVRSAITEASASDAVHEYKFTPPPQPIIANLDRQKVLQVIQNLLSNAALYSPNNTAIEVALESEAQKLRLTVHDYGMGISLEEQQHIFQPFYRTETAYKFIGAGLGLSIANSFVEAHRGRLWVLSAGIPGDGSTFIIELPTN